MIKVWLKVFYLLVERRSNPLGMEGKIYSQSFGFENSMGFQRTMHTLRQTSLTITNKFIYPFPASLVSAICLEGTSTAFFVMNIYLRYDVYFQRSLGFSF